MLNLLVRRHFPISSVLYNDVAGYARKIVYFSGRHSLQVLAPVWYKVVLVTIFRVTRGGFSHCFHFARMPLKGRSNAFLLIFETVVVIVEMDLKSVSELTK